MDRVFRPKINKKTQALNDTLHDMNLINIYRAFHPKAKYTFFSSAHRTFSKTDHILYWVTKQAMVNLRKLKSYQVSYQLQCSQIRNQSQERKKNIQKHKHVEVKQYVTKGPWITGEIKEKKILRDK